MKKINEPQLTKQQYLKIRDHAKLALEKAGALGNFPTKIDEILAASQITVADESLDESYIEKIRKRAKNAKEILKSAISKVIGLFHASAGVIFLDKAVQGARKAFLKLHELGHALLPWQKNIYTAVEDCEKTIAPEISDMFDSQANVFASEVLFQLDGFMEEAGKKDFSVTVPLNLAKKYGASAYASIRRYVWKNPKACAVVVLNPPELIPGDGFRATVRRVVTSESFDEKFGSVEWPECVTPDDQIGAMVPAGAKQRMSRKREIGLRNANGDIHECIAEAFKTPYNVFVLILETKSLTSKTIIF